MFKFTTNNTLKSRAFQILQNNLPKRIITSKISFKTLFTWYIPRNNSIQNVFSPSTKQNNIYFYSRKSLLLRYNHDVPEVRRHCWKCDSEIDYLSIHCDRKDCGVIQNVFPDNVNYFEILGVGNKINGE